MNSKNETQLLLQLFEAHGRTEAQYVPGKTMPNDVPIVGNIVAWDDYVRILAIQQLGAYKLQIHPDYARCLNFFRSSPEKMNTFRLLYLLNDANTDYTIKQLAETLNVSRPFVHTVLRDAAEEGFVEKKGKSYILTGLGIEAFRHYATNWWTNNEANGLAGAFYRVYHARKSVTTEYNLE
jgi:predicted transcriptional regulator